MIGNAGTDISEMEDNSKLRTFRQIRNHIPELLHYGLGLFWPANTAVVVSNALSVLQGEPWTEFVRRKSGRAGTYRSLIRKSLNWLRQSERSVGSGGIGCYEFCGWTRAYPEVTGYIIPTIWDCYHFLKEPDLGSLAVRLAEWEISIQRRSGGFEGRYLGDGQPEVVFNTGQVVRGQLRTYLETGENRFLETAVRAADWIVANQESDGSWSSRNYRGMKRVYDTYVAAPLARLGKTVGNQQYIKAAEKNCAFALGHQLENGWFDLCDNTPYLNFAPVTHTVAYTVDGLIESGELLGEERFISAGLLTTGKLLHLAETGSRFYARYDRNWRPVVKYVCVAGVAQTGILFMNAFLRTQDPRYFNAALKFVDFLAYVQHLNSWGKNRRGALAGSYPVWGMYAPFKFPSWAGKYFIDLLLTVDRGANEYESQR